MPHADVSAHDDGRMTRKYQEEMLRESLKRNIIVVLDTGSGKTRIAILRMGLEVERQASLGSNKTCWFLVPTVALCEQQTEVFKEHLTWCNIDSITGQKQPEKWTSPSLWQDIVNGNQIVVSTPQVLLEALRHGYVKLGRDISLIIFDEAHHALKGHPYARIMREYFDDLPEDERPHIMGLTASPLNVHILEQNLLCRAMTTQENADELQRFVYPPTFKHVIYKFNRDIDVEPPSLTSLREVFDRMDIANDPYVKILRRQLAQIPDTDAADRARITAKIAKAVRKKNTVTWETMKKLLQSASDTFCELGPWATEWFIAHSISKLLQPVDAAQEFSFFGTKREKEETEYMRTLLRNVAVTAVSLGPDDLNGGVSDQVEKLIEVLLEEKRIAEIHNDQYSGIIFVKLRTAALLLSKILAYHPASRDDFKVGYLVGWSNDERRRNDLDLVVGAAGEGAQKQTLLQFREGKINLVIATSVLEEGLDVPICGSVIRFNPPDNITSWVQSRGRARAKRSSFVVMYNDVVNSMETISKLKEMEERMNALYKAAMRERAVGPPQRSGNEQLFRVESTGALLTQDNATSHIAHFCDTLPRSQYARMVPIYDVFPPDAFIEEFSDSDGELPPLKPAMTLFGCTLTLPNLVKPQYRRFETPMIHSSEKAAKRQVAFDAYEKLYKAGLINAHLLPFRREQQRTSGTTGEQGQRESIMTVVPQQDAWLLVDNALGQDEYWSCVLDVSGVGEIEMVSKVQPTQSSGKIVLYEGDVKHSVSIRDARRVALTAAEVDDARAKTRQLWWSAYGSHMRWERTDFRHLFIVPREKLESSWRPAYSRETLSVPVQNILAQHGMVDDLFVIRDSRDERRSRYEWYHFKRWRLEPLTEDEAAEVAKRYLRAADAEPLQPPFIEAVKLRRQANCFEPDTATAGNKSKIRILLPQFCNADILSPALGRLSLFIPSILRDMQATVLSTDIQRHLFASATLAKVPLADIRAAITTPLTGYRANYQRLETLGDCVLKFLTSVQLLDMYPEWHEGLLSMDKDQIVSNYNLAKENVKNELARWIIRDRVVARKWRPVYTDAALDAAQMTAKEKEKDEKNKEPKLSTKVLADVVESLIGAAHDAGGYDAAVELLAQFKVGERLEVAWLRLSQRVESIVNRIEPLPPGFPVDYVETLERMLGHTFKHPTLLFEALTHANYTGVVHTVSYERLEFLGDSLLDNVVTELVYRSSKRLPPVLMTRCRIATVNTEILAFCCANLVTEQEQRTVQRATGDGNADFVTTKRSVRLPTFLRLSNIAMIGVLHDYVAGVERANEDIKHKLLHGSEFPWTELFALRAPKFLSDIVESLIAAIYLDTAGDMSACERFIERLGILPVVRHLVEDGVDVRHPLTVLGEYAAKSRGKLKYKYATENPDELTCSVLLNDELILTVKGDNRVLRAREELKVRAAAEAFPLINRRQAADKI